MSPIRYHRMNHGNPEFRRLSRDSDGVCLLPFPNTRLQILRYQIQSHHAVSLLLLRGLRRWCHRGSIIRLGASSSGSPLPVVLQVSCGIAMLQRISVPAPQCCGGSEVDFLLELDISELSFSFTWHMTRQCLKGTNLGFAGSAD
ncbi:hypothetical protein C4D60_Mb09t20250 [Musa balbisiana]|uniref:Uncharacterized protein n=1 Tax=Musa balbisiana TaxID=52838 RepID=A0A4S8IJ42_MUSBA|nr:hypothetical protein C4D60_Mb09t20250 [Musa balbisiana]